MHPLVEEAMKKAAVAWIAVGGRAPVPIWCLWFEGALYAVGGPGEQPAAGLIGAHTAAVTARGDHGGRIITWPARVERVRPGTGTWDAVVPQLAAKRLNGAPAAELAERWAAGCTVFRLVPDGEPTEAGRTLPRGSLAAEPAPTPATSPTEPPFRLHRVRPRRR
jgi:hypothetical protein